MTAQTAIHGILTSGRSGQSVSLDVFEGFLQTLSAGSANQAAVVYGGGWIGERWAWQAAEALTQQSSNGGGGARNQGGGNDIFKHAPPEGYAKTFSGVVGEIVWLMSQSPIHKQFFIADLEWFVMTPILLKQFRLFYAKNKPVGVVLWAFVDDEVAKRLSDGTPKLRSQDWKSGDALWVVEAIAPFGGPEEMIKNLKKQVFADKTLRYLALSTEGKKEVRML